MRLRTGRNGAFFAQQRVDLSFLSLAHRSSVPPRAACRLQGRQEMRH
jgi:hypothetical protein